MYTNFLKCIYCKQIKLEDISSILKISQEEVMFKLIKFNNDFSVKEIENIKKHFPHYSIDYLFKQVSI